MRASAPRSVRRGRSPALTPPGCVKQPLKVPLRGRASRRRPTPDVGYRRGRWPPQRAGSTRSRRACTGWQASCCVLCMEAPASCAHAGCHLVAGAQVTRCPSFGSSMAVVRPERRSLQEPKARVPLGGPPGRDSVTHASLVGVEAGRGNDGHGSATPVDRASVQRGRAEGGVSRVEHRSPDTCSWLTGCGRTGAAEPHHLRV